jgi:hypothetical protein
MLDAIAITQATPGDLAAVLAIDDRPDRARAVSEIVYVLLTPDAAAPLALP